MELFGVMADNLRASSIKDGFAKENSHASRCSEHALMKKSGCEVPPFFTYSSKQSRRLHFHSKVDKQKTKRME
eukprot:m.137863 g.137863  ORF g.137863 m.137863 type:complete len:73 (-) comp13149_c1_seq1:221-439(-)